MSTSATNSASPAENPALEPHYSPDQLAEVWSLSPDTVRRMFEREPGVIIIEKTKGSTRRRYRTIRIPQSVALRVHRRLTNNPVALLNR